MSFDFEDFDPIDVAEVVADHNQWEYNRIGEDQIGIAITGKWYTYSVTLHFAQTDDTLRVICTFDFNPDTTNLPAVYELLNLVNDRIWGASIIFWPDQKLLVFRAARKINENELASQELINEVVEAAIATCDQFYPAVQLVACGDESPETAMNIAIGQTYGRA